MVDDEADAVLAFIRQQQPQVLARAIDELARCPVAEVPAVAHSIHGTLGSYQLDAEHAVIVRLRSVLSSTGSTGADVEAARAAALADLRHLLTERTS